MWWNRRHSVAAGRLGQGLGAEHVGPEEPGRVEDGQAVVRLGGEVDDHVDLVLGQGLGHRLEVADVALDEVHPALQVVEVGQVPGVGEHVEGHHGVLGVVVDPVPDEVRADEAGAAGDEKSHNPGMLVGSSERLPVVAPGQAPDRTWTTSPATTVRVRPPSSTTRWPSAVSPTAVPRRSPSASSTRTRRPSVVHRSGARRPGGPARPARPRSATLGSSAPSRASSRPVQVDGRPR